MPSWRLSAVLTSTIPIDTLTGVMEGKATKRLVGKKGFHGMGVVEGNKIRYEREL